MNKKLSNKIESYIKIQKDLIDYIWINKGNFTEYFKFDYPEYCGIPKRLQKYFSSNFVDLLQEEVFDDNDQCNVTVIPGSKEELTKIILHMR